MVRIPNWSLESRTPALTYRNTETSARTVLHQAPDSFPFKWRAAILVEGYPVWSSGYETKESSAFREALRERPAPELVCPARGNEDVIVGQKAADGAKLKRWFDCPDCGYEVLSRIVYGAER